VMRKGAVLDHWLAFVRLHSGRHILPSECQEGPALLGRGVRKGLTGVDPSWTDFRRQQYCCQGLCRIFSTLS
jgi:hypothetical protein